MWSLLKFIFVFVVIVGTPVLITIFVHSPYLVISVYGICLAIYSFIQILFSYLNRKYIEKITNNSKKTDKKYNILVVGYKEDQLLFKKCLQSMKMFINDVKIGKIIVVIDGDTPDDEYMVDTFKEVFNENSIAIKNGIFSTPYEKAICISQVHEGKRGVLYTGLKMSILMGVYGVICTDSDTVFHKDVILNLSNVLEYSDDIGAVTGNVEIINKNTIISYLSYLRYWFSCNIERAYQSYNGCVMCVSGPIGAYKTEYLSKILEDWYTQKFLGQQCTYGDDRHLTNNILILGKKVLYTHLATCYTDTPETLNRFFTQQVRWCKSSYREVLWTMKCLSKHSFFMTVDIVYQTFYNFAVFIGLIYIIIFGSIFQSLIYLYLISCFNIIKSFYAIILEKNIKFISYGMYGFVYIFVLVPARIYASLTLKDISWGTSSRNYILNVTNYWLYTWIVLLLSGFIIKFSINYNEWNITNIILFCCFIGYVSIQFIYIRYSLNK